MSAWSDMKTGRFWIQLAILVVMPTAIAFAVNAIRPKPLDWIAQAPYEIYADCPEAERSAKEIPFQEVLAKPKSYLLIDSRSKVEHEKVHPEGSVSIPYDSLFPVSDDQIEQVRDKSKGRVVVVFGDGEDSKRLADDLVSQGLLGIRYLPVTSDWLKLLPSGGRP